MKTNLQEDNKFTFVDLSLICFVLISRSEKTVSLNSHHLDDHRKRKNNTHNRQHKNKGKLNTRKVSYNNLV